MLVEFHFENYHEDMISRASGFFYQNGIYTNRSLLINMPLG